MLYILGIIKIFVRIFMEPIEYIDRISKEKKTEKVYGQTALSLVYGDSFFSKIFSYVFLGVITKISFFSKMYGFFQKTKRSRKKVKSFIQKYHLDSSEFEKTNFSSFNDFFIRKLKKEARPVEHHLNKAILPADGRYFVFPRIDKEKGFFVKDKKFCLKELLGEEQLFLKYEKGTMVIARLCPVDYHRFHFPVDCRAGEAKCINGYLHSVNLIALKKNARYLCENKRYITSLDSKLFGKVLFIEVGATFVGSVHQTYTVGKEYNKAEEKGYFSFGGSCIILLFEENVIELEEDLVKASKKKIEVKGLMGQSLGLAKSNCK